MNLDQAADIAVIFIAAVLAFTISIPLLVLILKLIPVGLLEAVFDGIKVISIFATIIFAIALIAYLLSGGVKIPAMFWVYAAATAGAATLGVLFSHD